MQLQDVFNRLGNPLITALLRSRLHGLMGASTLLITVKGRRSGHTYTTPVNFVADGERLSIVSLRQRTWWRNLRTGAEVGLRLHGVERRGQAVVVEEDAAVAAALADVIRRVPAYARLLGVPLQPDGTPQAEALRAAARMRVIVNVQLL